MANSLPNKKKIEYFIDKVTEDSFYENLLLGLPKALNKIPNIHNKKIKRNPPATKQQVRNWETTHGVKLPQDLQNFYQSCNGLTYTYQFSYRREDVNDSINCIIDVNPIDSLEIVENYPIGNIFEKLCHDGYLFEYDLPKKCKVFGISSNDEFKTVLVYTDPTAVPSIWILVEEQMYFIANDITTYLKMAIAHLGLPCWQFVFTPMSLPSRSRELLNFILPGMLLEKSALASETNGIVNQLNPGVFQKIEFEEESNNISKEKNGGDVSDHSPNRKSSKLNVPKKTSLNMLGKKPSSVISASNSKRNKTNRNVKKRPFTPKF